MWRYLKLVRWGTVWWCLIRVNHTLLYTVSLWLNCTSLDCKPIHKAGKINRQKCDRNISELHGLIIWWRRRESMSRLLSPLILSSINRYRKKRQEMADSSQIAGGLAATTETNTAPIACPWRSRTRDESAGRDGEAINALLVPPIRNMMKSANHMLRKENIYSPNLIN
jgi:hypothetical protein